MPALALLGLLAACSAENALSNEQLSRAVEAQRPALKPCYDAALERTPYKHEMKLDAIIHVAESGRVAKVELEGGKGLPGMGECLRKAIAAWHFPSADGDTHTRLPLIFKPEIVRSQPNLDTVQEVLRQMSADAK